MRTCVCVRVRTLKRFNTENLPETTFFSFPIYLFCFYFYFQGPAFWGLINPEWSLCNRGRRQSPVNLEPDKLLFDPNLRSLHIDKHRVSFYIQPIRKLFFSQWSIPGTNEKNLFWNAFVLLVLECFDVASQTPPPFTFFSRENE